MRHPSVFVVLGSGPIWTAGSASYIATLIALAGGTNAAADLHGAYGEYSAEALVRDQPDVLVADPAIASRRGCSTASRGAACAPCGSVTSTPSIPTIIERPGPQL